MMTGRWQAPRVQWLRGVVLLAVLALAGCGAGGSSATANSPTPTPTSIPSPTIAPTEAPTPTVPPNTVVVNVKNFAFNPSTLTIKKGMTVLWRNNSPSDHTATSDAGAPVDFEGDMGADGGTASFTFTKPGVYHYHCSIHPFMKATITVTA